MLNLKTSTLRGAGICFASVMLMVFAFALTSHRAGTMQKSGVARDSEHSIQGYVATVLSSPLGLRRTRSTLSRQVSTSLGSPIFLPDIDVSAKNLRTGVTSAQVVTNPQGYFVLSNLSEGAYQICVSGTGYTSQCEDRTVSVVHAAEVLDHIVMIQPSGGAIAGAVSLADRSTPCFWFRPAMSPQALTAKVSLLDGNQVVAGPVNGNSSGQYVLPTPAGNGNFTLRAVCDTGRADTAFQGQPGFVLQDVAINNRAPQILALDFTKGAGGARRANPGDTIRVTAQASDLDNDTLHYSWADDSGRSLGLPDLASVDWPLPNYPTLNTIHVQVSDSRGGIATISRSLEAGPDAIFFAGRVFDRQTLAPIKNAAVSLNKVMVKTDAGGHFLVSVPDASQFVLNVTKPGFALSSSIYHGRVTNIAVPLDAVQITTVNAGTGGTLQFPPAGCHCRCGKHDHEENEHEHHGARRDRDDRDKDDKRDKDDHGKDRDLGRDRDKDDYAFDCPGQTAGGGNLSVVFPADALETASGTKFTGTASVEGFQYDLTKPNPIPGDFGAIYQGQAVRLGTFGAFHILPRDSQGRALKMAANKNVNVSMPIQAGQLGTAPASIPFFHYDEDTGTWIEDGTLTRSGNRYVGKIGHFSIFNADTVFPGGACVKALLVGFTPPVTFDASYFDSTVGSFNHNGSGASDTTIGIERMAPFQNFTLAVTDSSTPPAAVSVALNSGPPIDPANSTAGLDNDSVNFSHCNGPVQIYNNTIPAATPYFLGPVFGGSITDHSADYKAATDAQTGGTRDTFPRWKSANGFPTGEASAIYFNNGDLKFGRDMHCRVTNTTTKATACYVSNFGNVGTDDSVTSLAQAETWEGCGQCGPPVIQPTATVTMEYDPVKGVQFWAYDGTGAYLALPKLDSQGPKPIPDICMACHFGTYSGQPGATVIGAVFLPFDLDSFLDDTGTPFPSSVKVTSTVQQQFHALNNMMVDARGTPGVIELVNQLWYPGGTGITAPFVFNRKAAQLPTPPPFIETVGVNHINHEPLYDNVVREVCRTCHVAITGKEWDKFAQMSGESGFIQSLACAPTLKMPHAEVPWIRFWQESMPSTLASELSFPSPGCPNQ